MNIQLIILLFNNLIFVFPILVTPNSVVFTTVKSDLHGVIFQYFGKSYSEKFLPVCEKNAVCSIAHNRFWLRPMITRLCRCPSGFDCPWQVGYDEFSMSLNNRSILKFCDPVNTTLKICKEDETAMSIEFHTINNKLQKNPPEAIATCNCPPNSYWKHKNRWQQTIGLNPKTRIIDYYKCHPLEMCNTNDFCGHVHYNFSSIYYRCSCPENHLCINRDFNITYVDELFYQEEGFQAYCVEKSFQ